MFKHFSTKQFHNLGDGRELVTNMLKSEANLYFNLMIKKDIVDTVTEVSTFLNSKHNAE